MSRRYTYRQVQEVRLVLGLVPFFFYKILYWTLYKKMTTFYVLEGDLMTCKIRVGDIPAASMSFFNTLAIIILIPLYDKVIIPTLKRMGWGPTNLQRIGCGRRECTIYFFVWFYVDFKGYVRFERVTTTKGPF